MLRAPLDENMYFGLKEHIPTLSENKYLHQQVSTVEISKIEWSEI